MITISASHLLRQTATQLNYMLRKTLIKDLHDRSKILEGKHAGAGQRHDVLETGTIGQFTRPSRGVTINFALDEIVGKKFLHINEYRKNKDLQWNLIETAFYKALHTYANENISHVNTRFNLVYQSNIIRVESDDLYIARFFLTKLRATGDQSVANRFDKTFKKAQYWNHLEPYIKYRNVKRLI